MLKLKMLALNAQKTVQKMYVTPTQERANRVAIMALGEVIAILHAAINVMVRVSRILGTAYNMRQNMCMALFAIISAVHPVCLANVNKAQAIVLQGASNIPLVLSVKTIAA